MGLTTKFSNSTASTVNCNHRKGSMRQPWSQ